MQLVETYMGVAIYFDVSSYSAPSIREYGYSYEPQVKAAIRRYLKKNAAKPARVATFVECPGCLKRGAKTPVNVKPGFQRNTCADIEEGAF